ncbi:MAG: GNAT family N-acetyltransferase [Paracoccaceae bacterium]
MRIDLNRYEVRLAESDEEVAAAQRLRYRVFVEEMGAVPSPENRKMRLERDRFDPYFDHLIMIDRHWRGDPLDRVVGVYRLLCGSVAEQACGFYGADEYDLSLLANSGRKTVELGRSCVAAENRGGPAVLLLWKALADYVIERDIKIMFGVASFHGTDPGPIAEALSYLYQNHLAPPDLRVRARPDNLVAMDRVPAEEINAARAMREMPSLIKSYLRLGGFVGEGAYADRLFNTIDVCLLMDTERMTARYRNFYTRGAA